MKEKEELEKPKNKKKNETLSKCKFFLYIISGGYKQYLDAGRDSKEYNERERGIGKTKK